MYVISEKENLEIKFIYISLSHFMNEDAQGIYRSINLFLLYDIIFILLTELKLYIIFILIFFFSIFVTQTAFSDLWESESHFQNQVKKV